MTKSQQYNATIARRHDLHANLMLLSIVPDGGEFAPFLPGQFVSIGRVVRTADGAELVKRSYSIGSSATDRSSIELFLVHVNDGEFTSWLFGKREGSRLWMSPRASGGFTLEGFPPGQDLVLVSTGTAVAPYVSMIRTHQDDPPWRRLVLINGVRCAADLGYRAELEAAARRPGVTYLPMVTREPPGSDWNGLRGRVGEALVPDRFAGLTGFPLDPDSCHVYLCGNPLMIEDTEQSLRARGFRKHTRHHPGTLHLEKYWNE
ncbi:MAG TPA: ferredoxin--NADP reductase [Candidatus Krumholzibacteria bacterium]|nr:ferredoxin--NADP reductase [Candidatus Krumholzibacteria bacterium]